jgi:hypothetical protein
MMQKKLRENAMTRGRIIAIVLTSIVLSVLIQLLLTTVLEIGVRPDIEILNTEGHEYFFGLDYGYVINVELSNKGREGAAIVGVELQYGNEKFSRSQTVYLRHKETQKVAFEFLQPTIQQSQLTETSFAVRVFPLRR